MDDDFQTLGRSKLLSLLLCVAMGASGCSNTGRRSGVNSGGYNAFNGDPNARLQQELADAQEEIVRLEKELRGREEIQSLAEQRIENFKSENEKLHQELSAVAISNGGGRGLNPITTVAASALIGYEIPAEIRQELSALSKKYQGIEYDSLKRLCRFQSELTFLDGGDRLRPEARAALKELAQILTKSEVANLNLQIVGYTGAGSVSAELAAQHPTPWHLASHQAIAIEQYLEEQGVSPIRMGTVSYADKQPLVDGDDEATRRKNARVEIYILPPDPPAE